MLRGRGGVTLEYVLERNERRERGQNGGRKDTNGGMWEAGNGRHERRRGNDCGGNKKKIMRRALDVKEGMCGMAGNWRRKLKQSKGG